MPRIEHIVIGLIAVWAIIAIARHANRTEADKAKPSWAVRAVNAAGGNVEATRLLPAAGELIGRGAGAVRAKWSSGKPARAETREAQVERAAAITAKAREAAVRRGRAVVEATQRRWKRRADDRPLVDRRTGGDVPATERPAKTAGAVDPGVPAAPGKTAGDITPTTPDATAGTAPDSPAAAARSPRWRLLRRFTWWRPAAPGGEGPKTAPPGDGDGDSPLLGNADCPQCGDTVKGVIPASEQDHVVTCGGCGHRATFYRAPNDPPADPATDPCTPDRCTGSGTHVQITLDGVRKMPCPHCTPDKENTDMTAPTTNGWRTTAPQPDAATIAQLAPADWGQTAERIRDFEAAADYELINFMTGEVAGIVTYAESYAQLHEACVNTIGLDPVAVQGLGEFAEHVHELAKAMGDAHKQFLVQYEEVLRAVANGVVLPYNGRWLTGEAAI